MLGLYRNMEMRHRLAPNFAIKFFLKYRFTYKIKKKCLDTMKIDRVMCI